MTGGWAEVRTPDDGDDGAASVRRARKDQDQYLERGASIAELFYQGGVRLGWMGRPSRYTLNPTLVADLQARRTGGLISDVFALAARTTGPTPGNNARWQRDCIYQLAQGLRRSEIVLRAIDTYLGSDRKRRQRLDDILELASAEKQDGSYRLTCLWCGTRFTAKRPHARYHSNTCNQASRRHGIRFTDRLLNDGSLHRALESDRSLLGAIRSLAFESMGARSRTLNRAAEALEMIDGDVVSLVAELVSKEV